MSSTSVLTACHSHRAAEAMAEAEAEMPLGGPVAEVGSPVAVARGRAVGLEVGAARR